MSEPVTREDVEDMLRWQNEQIVSIIKTEFARLANQRDYYADERFFEAQLEVLNSVVNAIEGVKPHWKSLTQG